MGGGSRSAVTTATLRTRPGTMTTPRLHHLGVRVRLGPPYRPAVAALAAGALVAAGLAGAAPAAAATSWATPAILGQTLRAPGPTAPATATVRAAAGPAATTEPTSTWTVSYDAGFQA